MKTEHILRMMADNVENGRKPYYGLLYDGKSCNKWGRLIHDPELYTIAPKTHIVNGFEVPSPMTEKPEVGSTYYAPDVFGKEWATQQQWNNQPIENRYLERGLCHSNKEDAIANAKAMAKVNPYE